MRARSWGAADADHRGRHAAGGVMRALRSGDRATRARLVAAGLAGAVALVGASGAIALPAQAATVYELEGEWDDDTPTESVATGDSIAGTWWANVNDDAEAPGNEPVDDVTITVTAVNAVFEEIPPACLTEGVDPASEILDDGATLVCNGGTFDEGTAFRLDTSVTVTGESGAVSMSATVADQVAELPEIPIENPLLMDVVWDYNAGKTLNSGAGRNVAFNWTLFHGALSPDGPDTVTYRLSLSNTDGAPMQVGPRECAAFTTGGAVGHPYSGGDNPAEQMAPFVESCTLTRINNSTYDLTLTGIDYSHAQVPTEDSRGEALPTRRVAVASGEVVFRVVTDANSGTASLVSSAPTYTADGSTSEDDPANNSSEVNWSSGFGVGNWFPSYTNSSARLWLDQYRVAPGTEVQGSTSVNYANVDPQVGYGGLCVILDGEHVNYTGAQVVDRNDQRSPLDVPIEYLVRDTPIDDPNGTEVCGNDNANWVTSPPADLSTVQAVRSRFGLGGGMRTAAPQLLVSQVVSDDAAAGQDIWTWSAYRNTWNGEWVYNNRTMSPGDAPNTGARTPGTRYPYSGSGRDILRISTVTPQVDKTVEPTVVDAGGTATFTVNYTAEGTDVAETVDGYIVRDVMPLGATYAPGSADPEPETSTNFDGQQVLTWTLDGVPTNQANTLTYSADISEDVAGGDRLVNSVESSVGGGTASEPATASMTVNTAGSTSILKTADQAFIPNVNGDGVGEGSWTVDVVSEDSSAQAFTDTIDILPYDGDGRGTDMTGTYELSGDVTVSMGATVYYTTADPATLSDDPADAMNGSAGDTTGNTVGWTTTFDPDATAVRVITDELEPRGAFSFTVPIVTDGMEGEDVLVNRAQGRAENTRLVMRTSAPTEIANYYSANLKKYVQDSEGEWQDAQEPGTYPQFHVGDTVPYRIVVENTGQGSLTNVVVEDDLFPEGSFTIESLAPGESYVHEFEIVLTEPVGEDDVVNTACAEADIPADSQVPPEINCDPAGFTPVGDTTHTKELVSAAPIGGGQWEIVYEIVVESVQTPAAEYALADELHFTDQATITSAEVTASPADVTLTDPAWDGQGNLMVTDFAEIEGMDNPEYEPHVYQVTVVADVPLQLEGAGGADDPTACGAEDGEPEDRAFTNTSELTKSTGETEVDEACAELPSIDITKGVSAGPVPNGDGTWTVSYDLVATNDGAAEGTYEVTDQMTADGDLEVVSGEVVSAPDGVTPSASWTGLGEEGAEENVIASDVPLDAGGTHTYQIDVVVGIAEGTTGVPVITPCSALGEDGPGGLSNSAGIEHNDLTDTDEACVAVAYIVVDKAISEGPTPNGDGTFTIVYDLVAENVGGEAGDYDLTDRLQYGEGIEITEAGVVTAPDGVTTNDGWTGLGDEGAAANVVAEDVTLEAEQVHTYQVEVTVEMDEDTIDPAALECPPPGSGESGGLANSTALDHNGIVAEDDVCAALPLIVMDKELSEDSPVANGDGTWTITYDVVAENIGAATGDYDLSDELQYGEGIDILESAVVSAPDGVSTNSGWTGRGAAGAPENVIVAGESLDAGASHTFQVEVVASLDLETVTAETLECPEPGSGESGGFANTAELVHNGEVQVDEACTEPPLIDIAKSITGAVAPVEGDDGVYDATYELEVTNRGPGAGEYDLTDTLTWGTGITVVGIQDVTSDVEDSVGVNDGFDGVDDTLIVEGQSIAGADGAAVVHTYTVTVRYAADLSDVVLPDTDECTSGGDAVDGALNNVAEVDWNGIEDSDDECVRPGKPTLDKELVSAEPVGGGQWEVVYDLTVGNVGTEATTYDLDDELLFAEVITVDTVSVSGPDGVSVNDGFDGDGDQRIATDVSIAGLDDERYAPHVYTVTVVADVPLTFTDEVGEDGTGSPDCTEPTGSNLVSQGLNNAATLTDETGGTVTDTDCAPVPSIEITKSVVGEPSVDDGVWTVAYEIVASNDGAARGVYTLTDRLRFGAGIEVESATVTEAPKAAEMLESWTGLGDQGAAENVVTAEVGLKAGGEHTYRVEVTATVDGSAADASTWTCPEPGSDEPGGFANVAGIGHNDLTAAAEACAEPTPPPGSTPPPAGDEPDTIVTPVGSLPRTGATIAGILALAVLLTLAGAYGVRAARRTAG
ncbi:hypothetical protein UQW22_07420 [Isoptericola halotolerans]|uniref:DUF7507 domain-containing protein n=1 Tax=Isoptericola halotolerans TaxID=300560 RepID=UPI00388ED873